MNLKSYRKVYLGLNLRDMAEIIGCSASTLYRIEEGQARPTFDMADAIVKATKGKVTMADIYRNGKAA